MIDLIYYEAFVFTDGFTEVELDGIKKVINKKRGYCKRRIKTIS